MTRTITTLFDTYDEASAAVTELEAASIPHSQISIVAGDAAGRHGRRQEGDRATAAAEDAGRGVGIGAVVGGAGGLLAGLGVLAIPGVGPVVAAGWLVSTLVGVVAGGVVGGAAGGLVGSLTQAGVPENRANVYAEGVRRGGALVTVRVGDDFAAVAEEILDRPGAVDPEVRGQAYRQAGWSRFDEAAPPWAGDDVARERESRLASEDRSFAPAASTEAGAEPSERFVFESDDERRRQREAGAPGKPL